MKSLPINLKKWLAEHRAALKPPVGNKCIYDAEDFVVMVVAGPNQRIDFHVDPYEEFFYQLEGDILLKTIEKGKITDVIIKEGEIYLLPKNVPHSPRRPANTLGIVIERKRKATDQDVFQWYCEKCGNKLHEEKLFVGDFEKDLKTVFDGFSESSKNLSCKKCSEKFS
jgi:3-hydroxyanthranilate 3,4-dioxygenase